MQIVRDEAQVRRRKKTGQITSFLGLGILIAGMAFTWLGPKWGVPLQYTVYIPFLTLLVGFILSSVGIYFTNRWGRSPRPDELIDQSLKGLGRQYKLYHFALSVPHLLLTPSGLVPLVIRVEGGVFAVEGDRWRQKLSLGRVLRFMGQEGLGNPTKEALYQVEQMRRLLGKHEPGLADVPVDPVIVFLADGAVLNVGETSVPVLRAAKLKGFLRSQESRPLPSTVYRQLEAALDKAAGLSS